MRAVYFERPRAAPVLTELPDPMAPTGGVVVEVEATGLCRSDWHAWAGHDPSVPMPHVPGHEFLGRIREVGTGVERFAVGQRVTVPFVCGCGTCDWCESGNAQVCPAQTQPGFTHFGSWAEQVAVEAADLNLVAVPDSLPAEAVVGLGCRFATAYRGLAHRARVRAGERIAVFGCGGVGLSAVMIGVALGAEVLAVDINPGALEQAVRHGATHTLDSTGLAPDAVAAAVCEIVPGGVEVTVEALGRAEVARAAIGSLAPLGRHVQIGLFPSDPVFAVPRVVALELSVLGSHGMAAVDYPELMELVTSGRLRPQDLVTRTIGLAEAPAALQAMDAGTHPGMTIIRP